MANYFPLPESACTYQFDADQLPAAAMVTCPIAARASPTARQRPPPRRRFRSKRRKVHGEAQATAATAPQSAPRERVNRLVNPRDIPRGNKTQTTLMILGFAMAGITLVAIVVISMKKGFFGSGNDEVGKDYVTRISTLSSSVSKPSGGKNRICAASSA